MGPGKSRQRSTAAPTPITCNVPLTPAQAVSLESFYKSDCAYGALAFDWKHPRTGAAKSLEFMSPPRISARGAMYIGRLELRSEEHTSELQSLMRISSAVFCLKKKNTQSSTLTKDEYSIVHTQKQIN